MMSSCLERIEEKEFGGFGDRFIERSRTQGGWKTDDHRTEVKEQKNGDDDAEQSYNVERKGTGVTMEGRWRWDRDDLAMEKGDETEEG